ncbi:condensation domain-containing protein [Streptomyces sp. NRRL F-5123]|uniref:condensation domain-containing protein n=1 Tax=Streptomyces sp. NRRL F-5123 TaxID=1463856 RepID=UPI0004E19B0F|nr:condensation domain-containing protein [Streptomyces sp. NRRL F-5123]
MHGSAGLEVRFEGLADGSRPATWGQRTIWEPISWYAPDDHYFNIALPLALRHPVPPGDFAEVVRALLERHESLRTVYRLDAGGGLRQRLGGAGTLTVRLVEADAAEELARVLEREAAADKAVRFDLLGDGLPVRVTAVLVAGQVAGAVVTVAHIAADGTGAQVVLDDLRRLLAQRRRRPGVLPPPVPGRQPREQAEYEAGPQATARSAAAVALWSRRLTGIPASLWPEDAGPGEDVRWWEGELGCERLDLASRLAAVGTGTSPSAVVLAALGQELAERTGFDAVPLKVILGNRVNEEQRTAVGAFAQNGLVVLGGSGEFGELARKAWRAQLQTSRHGHYDPGALAEAVTAEEKRRGAALDLNALFNDHRETEHGAAAPDPSQLAAAQPGEFRWRSRWARQDCRFFFGLGQQAGRTCATLLVDTRSVPAAEVEPLLRAVEERVVAAALA